MGQVRHGSATTTHAVRAAIQRSQASISELSRELGINPKTVAKWRKRATVEDLKTGPKEPRSTVLTEAEEAMVVAFRRHGLLPLDDCLYALQPSIPHLTRSALHRCLQRHGISRLPDVEGTNQSGSGSSDTQSVSFISTSPRFRRRKASSTSLWVLIGLASLPSPNLWKRRIARPRGSSLNIYSRLFLTATTRSSPKTASSSQSSLGIGTQHMRGR